VDEDTEAFKQIMNAFALPKNTEKEKEERKNAIDLATKNAIEVPLKVMQLAHNSMEMIKAMAELGNPNSVSDAGVGALCARTAVYGAWLNVKINTVGFSDTVYVQAKLEQAQKLLRSANKMESEILQIVESKISKE
jgi:glutamate formiminotransferase/formiminotetrahydrofolate cyclodeaminase